MWYVHIRYVGNYYFSSWHFGKPVSNHPRRQVHRHTSLHANRPDSRTQGRLGFVPPPQTNRGETRLLKHRIGVRRFCLVRRHEDGHKTLEKIRRATSSTNTHANEIKFREIAPRIHANLSETTPNISSFACIILSPTNRRRGCYRGRSGRRDRATGRVFHGQPRPRFGSEKVLQQPEKPSGLLVQTRYGERRGRKKEKAIDCMTEWAFL